jgi:hypothetical protein
MLIAYQRKEKKIVTKAKLALSAVVSIAIIGMMAAQVYAYNWNPNYTLNAQVLPQIGGYPWGGSSVSSWWENLANGGDQTLQYKELWWTSGTAPGTFSQWTGVLKLDFTSVSDNPWQLTYMKLVGYETGGTWHGLGTEIVCYKSWPGGIPTWRYDIYWSYDGSAGYLTAVTRSTTNSGVTVLLEKSGSNTLLKIGGTTVYTFTNHVINSPYCEVTYYGQIGSITPGYATSSSITSQNYAYT